MVGLVSLDPLCKLNTENLMMDPIVFEPYFRPQVWGGRRLEQYLGRPLPAAGAFGEAWVLSAQSLHVSRVAEGPLRMTSPAGQIPFVVQASRPPVQPRRPHHNIAPSPCS